MERARYYVMEYTHRLDHVYSNPSYGEGEGHGGWVGVKRGVFKITCFFLHIMKIGCAVYTYFCS